MRQPGSILSGHFGTIDSPIPFSERTTLGLILLLVLLKILSLGSLNGLPLGVFGLKLVQGGLIVTFGFPQGGVHPLKETAWVDGTEEFLFSFAARQKHSVKILFGATEFHVRDQPTFALHVVKHADFGAYVRVGIFLQLWEHCGHGLAGAPHGTVVHGTFVIQWTAFWIIVQHLEVNRVKRATQPTLLALFLGCFFLFLFQPRTHVLFQPGQIHFFTSAMKWECFKASHQLVKPLGLLHELFLLLVFWDVKKSWAMGGLGTPHKS